MAEVADDLGAARTRIYAQEVRLDSLRSRHAVAAGRRRRAALLHRPLVTIAPAPHVVRPVGVWGDPGTGSDVRDHAAAARERSVSLRQESHALRGAVAWQLRRLERTRRLTSLRWTHGTGELDDIFV